ncbi:AcrR family transcriptional regulator [Leifsonia sp. AK011]|uniref:TetR/AcrR family transcriptional regulator n=1 Tax=Leifsonia sp. AK011 TaxID=2723075 RepID=UPI0015CAB8F5|nr:TetR/AcrR family transcriptional regulator [Leifsonia sp. AK011]NYF10360.1 AcrR family transcriptional regulator [Leifsonia sp. AK011]
MPSAGRAPALSVEDRQAMIIERVIPLLLEHGREVTSRQIAEAAGVAEGTVFRAFGDKETLIEAAATAFLEGRHRVDLEPDIDPQLPLEKKLRLLVEGMRHRVRDVMRMAAVAGHRGPGAGEAQRLRFNAMISAVFDGDRAQLRIDPDELGDYLRMIAIASTIPIGSRQFSTDEIVGFLLHGLTLPPTSGV